MEKPKVYFTKKVTPESLIKIYEKLGKNLNGRVAIKLHSGEDGNQNFVKPEFVKPIIEKVNGTVVETNTAYEGERNTTEKHKRLLEKHGWTKYFDVDLLDGKSDFEIEIPRGKVIKKNYLGENIKNYDSMLVLSHFKGHPMGGYGGALKQLAIGCASSKGKSYIHTVGKYTDKNIDGVNFLPKQEEFLEAMADAAMSIIDYFKNNLVFINIMCNLSVDCDCCMNAEDPCMKDIGILASTDPIALDQACIDLIYNSKDEGRDHFVERVESRKGIHVIEAASELGYGSREYELIEID